MHGHGVVPSALDVCAAALSLADLAVRLHFSVGDRANRGFDDDVFGIPTPGFLFFLRERALAVAAVLVLVPTHQLYATVNRDPRPAVVQGHVVAGQESVLLAKQRDPV